MSGTDWKAKALEYEYMMDAQRRRTGVELAALRARLDSLNLSVKYLVFDLEATRRERDALKRQLEGS